MNADELIEWLLDRGVAGELATLFRINALQDLENVDPTEPVKETLARLDWNRLLLAGSILARSEARHPREAALLIATSAMTCAERGPIRDTAALLFEQLSNRVAVDLAQRKTELGADLDGRLGVSARLELTRNRLRNSVILEATGSLIEVNAFQHDFWTAARGGAWLSASAPTASGKTFLVVQWILDQVRSRRVRTVVYLAPTRALVSESEANLKGLLAKEETGPDGIEVSSLPLAEKYANSARNDTPLILVFTQERFHLFANALNDQMKIDLLVVDEAHKIGDVRRGVVLQDAIERASRASPEIRAVFISPATHNPGTLLDDAPAERERRIIDSDAPTVLQNVLFAQQVRKKTTKYHLSVRSGNQIEEIGILTLADRPTGLLKKIAFIAEALTGDRSGTLVYANGADEAEKIAFLLNQDASRERIDPELAALADLSRKGVHPDYLLAPLVERGVAFHYGNMPSLIRSEIERLFKSGKIRFLVCTSTLIEGVNLACRMIVLRGPRKGRGQHMLPHDFWNLAGRAGRWGNEFQGKIVCIDPYAADAWPNGVPERSRFEIRRETDSVLDKPEEAIAFISTRDEMTIGEVGKSPQLEQVSSYLLATYLRSGSLKATGLAKRHEQRTIDRIEEALTRLCAFNRIPDTIVARHPGVNAVAMQKLLNYFANYEGEIEDLLPTNIEDDEALQTTMFIMRAINDHLFPAFMPDTLIYGHAITVQRWLSGWPLSRMIGRRIASIRDKGEFPDIPKVCRQTMDMVEQTARFAAPKYFAAYVDILKLHLAATGKSELLTEQFDIGTSLEFGVSTRTLLSLMELGLSRMSATALYEIIKNDNLDQEECRNWMRVNNDALAGTGMPIIILRELREKLLDDGGGSADSDPTNASNS